METSYGRTRVIVCDNYEDLGKQSAEAVAACIREVASLRETVRVVFAAGESQTTFLRALAREKNIPWERLDCFNIDDFWDVRLPEHFSCGYQTTNDLYRHVNPRRVELVKFNAPDAEAECRRFAALLEAAPIDILCQGIGTSGHLALNEPFDTDLDDPATVRVVNVAEQSKGQLREDPNFRDLGYIPEKGITMTIPAILAAGHCFTMVPLGLKKPILTELAKITSPTNALPASVLLEKEGVLFVDKDSCPDCWK